MSYDATNDDDTLASTFLRLRGHSGIYNTNNSSDGDDYYIYDYNDSVITVELEEVVPVATVYGLMLLIGLVGNTLVIFSIVRYRRMRNVTNAFLLSLASADLLVVLICIPVKVRTQSMKSVLFV